MGILCAHTGAIGCLVLMLLTECNFILHAHRLEENERKMVDVSMFSSPVKVAVPNRSSICGAFPSL